MEVANSKHNVLDILQENVDVEGHLVFIESLLSRYAWPDEKKKQLENDVNIVRKKQQDPHLYLAVVGEFTSGKSTLINALLRDEILKTDILQATTAAATLITYGDSLNIEVTDNNGVVETYRGGIPFLKKMWRSIFKPSSNKIKEEVRQYIYKVTADEAIAKTVRKVTIEHPAQVLKDGIIIIDTPGTDVSNPRHDQVTKAAIREISDAAVIVISADKPVSQAIINFINNNLKEVISRCIFIVSKMDLLRPKERPRVLAYIRQRLQTEFEINHVNVFPYSPLIVLQEAISEAKHVGTISVEDAKTILEASDQTEKMIFSILKEQRIIIQLQKLVVLINQILANLETDLTNLERTYADRHAALENNRIKDIAEFVREQKAKHGSNIVQQFASVQVAVLVQIEAAKKNLVNQIKSELYATTEKSELKKFVKNRIDVITSNTQTSLASEMASLFDEFQKIVHVEKNLFEDAFKSLYMSLATLSGNIVIDEQQLGNQASSMISRTFSQDVTAVKEVVSSDASQKAWASFGGAGAGATIGTAILPGIGTAIGLVLGGFVSWLFGPSLQELQNKYFEEIDKTVGESFNKSLQLVGNYMQNLMDEIVGEMNAIIDNYFHQYDQLVKEMIRRDEAEKQELTRRRKMITEDLNQLHNRWKLLEEISKSLMRDM